MDPNIFKSVAFKGKKTVTTIEKINLLFRVQSYGGNVILQVCDADDTCGEYWYTIFEITENMEVFMVGSVPSNLGLPIDDNGKVKLRDD